MFTVQTTDRQHLPDVAACQFSCFPQSLATKLGKKYVEKTLEWFLVNPNRFLFHVMKDGVVAGYCGGFVPVKVGDGSSSGMLQYAFKEAVKGLMKNPLLLFHPEVRQHYPFLWMNIKRRITGKVIPMQKEASIVNTKLSYVGLVVIGVTAEYRGTGLSQVLMQEFEKRANTYNRNELVLSVKNNNSRAINAYRKSGWSIKKEQEKTFVMNKFI